jgi:hypothetical protein
MSLESQVQLASCVRFSAGEEEMAVQVFLFAF